MSTRTRIGILFTSTVILACFFLPDAIRAAREEAEVAVTEHPSGAERVKSLSWLQGRWRGTIGNATIETVYSGSEAGTIVSASKEMAGGMTRMVDFEVFQAKGNQVFLTPYPHGKKSDSFRLVDHDPKVRRAVFVNPEHDFPKKFTYERPDEARLVIRLEGDASAQPLVFELRRVDAAASKSE